MIPTDLHIVKDGGSTTRPDEAPSDELEALRSVTLRNMRLLRAQIVPLIDAALRSGGGERDGHRTRWTAAALRLIDETTIAAAAGVTGGPIVPMDTSALLARAREAYADRLDAVTMSDLPWLIARRDRLALLVDEVMGGIARGAAFMVPAGLCIDWVRDDEGCAVIRLCDAGLAVEGVDAGPHDVADAGRGWSVCRTLIAGMGGSLRLPRAGQGRLCMDLRFPASMVLEDGAA